MKGNAELTLSFSSNSEAQRVHKVLNGESFKEERSTISISRKGSKVLISIHAKDFVALRAAVNSYLRNVQLIDTLQER